MIEPQPNVSFADFVAWETAQHELHELIAGRIVPFLAGSADHALITGNVFAKLHASVDPPCRVFPSTTIVQTVSRTGKDGYRPDVTVSCSKANIGLREFIEAPMVVVEVVSPSNAGATWTAKLFEYWNTASIQQVVQIESRERVVTSSVRDESGLWMAPVVVIDNGALDFPQLSVSMPLERIYTGTSVALPRS